MDTGNPGRLLSEAPPASRPFAQPVAEDPLAKARARALEEGLLAGRAEARASFDAEVAAQRKEMAASLARLAELESTLRREHEARLLDVALAAAGRVVRERIEAGDPVAARALAEALDALPASGPLRVRLHPQDREPIAAEVASQIAAGRLTLLSDDTLARGGCIVEGGLGRVDARAEVALAAIAAAAREAAEGA